MDHHTHHQYQLQKLYLEGGHNLADLRKVDPHNFEVVKMEVPHNLQAEWNWDTHFAVEVGLAADLVVAELGERKSER